jgi:hypothetical protein
MMSRRRSVVVRRRPFCVFPAKPKFLIILVLSSPTINIISHQQFSPIKNALQLLFDFKVLAHST